MKTLCATLFLIVFSGKILLKAQPCTPLGDETTYGINDVWIGYVYDNINFTGYQGYINEGIAGNPAFNQSFGGSNVLYPTNGCSVNTETFSVRYKLRKTFSSGNYEFIVGGDDGYRLSIDGGATWIINRWFDQGYNTFSNTSFLNGTYDLVLEFYENGGGNQVSFMVQSMCLGTGNPAVYGTNDVWQGYVYDGTNFSIYKGDVTEGTAGDPNFTQNFGGSNIMYNTNTCAVQTETFSVRYRLRKTFANGTYLFIVGGDDGYRFSLDGGASWAINRWWDQSYNIVAHTAILNGTYDLVIEYYEAGGDNRISFDISGSVLPVRLIYFSGILNNNRANLQWQIATGSNPDYFEVERSADGQHFGSIGKINGNNPGNAYSYTDNIPLPGHSYYRLKMVDTDGNETFSQIISVSNKTSPGIKIYPTVVQNNTLFIQSGRALQNVSVSLFDMTGKKMVDRHIRSMANGQTVSVSLPSHIAPGIYLAEVKTNTGQQAKKLLIVQ
ncbi:MAG: T9SS type A sorting domain-containing protein [Chitinophagaceae bacterium]|nr:T9SS type A sorting domain-containing protein [Chitinophagaceae bacterium]